MSWRDAVAIVTVLANDPGSNLAAALLGWRHPVSREWMALRHFSDRFVDAQQFRKPKPYMPTPWGGPDRRSFGKAMPLTRFRALIEAHRNSEAEDTVETI